MRKRLAVGVVGIMLAGGVSGCIEQICSDGEIPVRAIDFPDDGRACTEDGQIPPGFEEYPPGQTPTTVY